LKEKLLALLRQQKIYWKQRGTIKWVKFGDEGSKFFHANATIKHRKNLITVLYDESGSSFNDHQSKAELLWIAYKERLGTTESPKMHFDLENLLHASTDLSFLETPFTNEEINFVVQQLPSDKSPGPDGFNTDFLK